MDIKWTAGPGPAPLPYSKRAREEMGYSDDDKPWAHPDPIPPPMAERLGLGGDLREGRLRTTLLLGVTLFIVAAWVYRRVVKRDRTPFFHVPPNPSEDVKLLVGDPSQSTVMVDNKSKFECRKCEGSTGRPSDIIEICRNPRTLSTGALIVSDKEVEKAREARLKRFQQQKGSYAGIMQEAGGGWRHDEGGGKSSAVLRKRGDGNAGRSVDS